MNDRKTQSLVRKQAMRAFTKRKRPSRAVVLEEDALVEYLESEHVVSC